MLFMIGLNLWDVVVSVWAHYFDTGMHVLLLREEKIVGRYQTNVLQPCA